MKLLRGGGIGFVLLLALACSPENKEVRTEQVTLKKRSRPQQILPSNRRRMALPLFRPTPPPSYRFRSPPYSFSVKSIRNGMNRYYSKKLYRQPPSEEQGPLLVKGNFDGNELQDIALQVRHQKNIIVVALLQDSSQWQLHELKKDILFNDRGAYKSLYFVYLTVAGSKIYNYRTRQNFTTPFDAVSVGIDNRSTTFVYEKGKFVAYDTGD